jgi:beta-glucanase (GH16 family)
MSFIRNMGLRLVASSVLALVLMDDALAAAPKTDDVPLPPPIAGTNYHLVKNWDFSKNVLGLDALHKDFYTRYAGSNGTCDHLGNEWERYRDNDNHEISGGALHLIARVPSGVLQIGMVESGMIRSKWETKYGYFEARMKVPKGLGMWPAFWFSADKTWPPEIDIMEVVNNGKWSTTTESFHSVHGNFLGKITGVDGKGYKPGFDYADGFHTFAIEWTPTHVRHYVDNQLVVEREFQWRQNNGADGDTVPVVVNLAVGGTWPGPPKALSEFPASLDVAYIRVWQKAD